MKHFYLILSLILAISFSELKADVLYVKPGTASTAWQNQTNVYSDLQTALAAAVAGDEVWVAAGIYKPTTAGNRDISFELKDGVHYYGGFAGDETELSQRDWRLNETILSGDIGVEEDNSDNSYHVVTLREAADVNLNYRTIVDGFIVEDGKGSSGTGFYIYDGDPIVKNCWFRRNQGSSNGGGVYSLLNARPLFGNVIFSFNSGRYGGSVYAERQALFYNCTWYKNYAEIAGAALFTNTSATTVYNSLEVLNECGEYENSYFSNSDEYSTLSFHEEINYTPLFIDPENGDFRLTEGSPVVDAGDNSYLPDWLLIDYSGNSRIQNEVVDLGVFEGTVAVPALQLPEHNHVFGIDVSSVELTWDWETFAPENLVDYTLEYSVNGGEMVQGTETSVASHTISGLSEGITVNWRVCANLSDGTKRWSPYRQFFIQRSHPLYVKPGATGSGDSWSDAINLSDAMKIAFPGEQIWVAAGIYTPTTGTSRDESFEFRYDLTLLGGFSGDETSPDERDWNQNQTILSGDIGVESENTDNSYHVIKMVGNENAPITQATVIDGIIVENGYTGYNSIASLENGAGMWLQYASPIVRNVIFRDNTVNYGHGGAVSGDDFSAALFGNVIFHNNSTTHYYGYGGAVNSYGGFEFYNCVWYDNYSNYYFGAVYGNSVVVNSIAWNNFSEDGYNDFSSSVTKRNTLYPDADDSNGSISESPEFVAPDEGDFRIRAISPALNAGSNTDVPEWLTKDYFGVERIQDGVVNMGVSEGVVFTPELLNPADSTVFESEQASVLFEWGWRDTQPVDVESYILEYSINENEPVLVENLESLNYTLSGLSPASVVQWRVASVDASGALNWSDFYRFFILRGHALYVTPDGSGTGSSWSDATNLQVAIDKSMKGDSIWMANGVYNPTNTLDRNASFELKDNVKIFGGFAGFETEFSERNWKDNETILSGNIGEEALNSDNSYRVLEAIGTSKKLLTEKTVLDGLIVEGGAGYNGSGIYFDNASILIRNLWIRDNSSSYAGGAVYVNYGSKPKFGNVLFSGNSAGDDGGAVCSLGNAEFYNCTWSGNSAGGRGGSVYGYATITNSISWGNNSGLYDNEFSSSNNVRNSIYETRDESNGNVSADPMFVAPDKNDFRLLAGSPGLNTGVNEDVPEWLTTDGFGSERIKESIVDVGSFEGAVESPKLFFPEDGRYFEGTSMDFLLEWYWENGEPADVDHYILEYSINRGEVVLVDDLPGTAYSLLGVSSATEVAWRVCSVSESGQETWSKQHHFSVLRGHPLFVTPEGTGEGTSWSDAMSLQDALDNAVDGDSIWVKAGIYTPTETADREVSFVLTEKIKLFGGFNGTETEFAQRNHILNKTILSGDIGSEGVKADNSFHVLSALGTTKERDDWSAVVDGVIIKDGYADGSGESRNGGGLYLQWASPLFINVHFTNNYALNDGGAVYDAEGSQAGFVNVLFTDNASDSEGGAVYAQKYLRYYNCVWFNNSSGSDGGAAYGRNKIVNSIFWKNSTQNDYNNDLSRQELVSYTIYDKGDSDFNLKGDPGFVDAENGDFRLRDESIALNAGSNDALPEWLTTDYFGNSRILADTVDIGISEGAVVGPVLLAPENQSVLSIVEGTTIMLKWAVEDSEVAATISDYQLEYVIGEDTTLVENIEGYDYGLSGLAPLDLVKWRVGYVDGSGNTNWSVYASFSIYRGHPLFVVPNGTGDGSSWGTGIDLKDALNIVAKGDSLWISAGIYKPTNTTDRTSSFVIDENLKLFGGFSGVETFFEERNTHKNQVVLSGDIGEPGVEGDNSYHVVRIFGVQDQPVTEQMILDGVTIENGFSDVYDVNDGGGLIINRASPIIKNVWFRNNFASDKGGAVYVDTWSNPLFGNVLFQNNEAGDNGGAVYSDNKVNYYNCVWSGNYSGYYGGAVYDNSSTSLVYNSIAWDNEARWSYDNFSYGVSSFYSIFNNAVEQNGNLNQEPGFVSVEKADFRLKEGSPAINTGSTENLPDWLVTDYHGNSRIQGDTVDMGAIEGWVICPTLVSPADKSWLDAGFSGTKLEWGWNDSIPNNINGFVVEYIINGGESQLIEDLTALETQLTGLQSADVVSWRVGSLEDTGFTNWSESRTFTVNRDHPLYVKPGATGNGTSWLDAMDLKDAMAISIENDEIWIAAGTYKPADEGDRNATFELKNGMKLYGGFGGFESSVEERDWMANETILSGDIGVEGDVNDNSYNILRVRGSEDRLFEDNVVDGFIIEKGKARYDGGGIYIRWSSPKLRNIWLRDNLADRWGGAVYSQNGSNPTFSNVLFVNNSAASAGAAVMASSDATFNNCLWYGNTTTDIGGAIYKNNWVSVEVNNSIAWNNHDSSDSDFNFTTGIENSVFADADGSNGNIAKDPLFVDADNSIFHLQKGSPAINAGDNDLVADELLTDYAGFDRTFGDNVDIGPFEYLQIQPVAPTNGGSGTKEYSMLMMLNLVWGISDGTIEPQTNIPSDFEYQMKLWKVGDEDNLLEDGPFSASSGIDGTNNSTIIGGLEYGSAYQWTIGLDYGDYVNWSEPSTFYIGHDYTIKVKEGSTGTTGASWDDAFGTLHEALDFALPGDEIWVAEGKYYPVTPADPSNVTQAEREQALSLKPGIIIYGGLAGDESNAWNRNHVEHPVILSGDIGVAGDDSDNSIHLFRNEFDVATPLGRGAVIEGFIFEDATGSAIYNVNSSPSIEFSVFRNNSGDNGGAVYNDGSSPRFFNVLFHDNEASGNGGAIFADGDSKPELLSCTVAHNRASNTGGLYGTFDVKNSIVYSNENGAFSDAASQVVYSCVEGGYEGEENISYDPLWTDPQNRDYSLQLFSPCIEQGNNKWFTGLFGYDLAKNSRTHWLKTDMGAYEATENGKLEVVESSVDTDGLTDFIDSIAIRFNQPIAVDPSVSPVLNPDLETELSVSPQDPSLLIISHTGLQASTDYHLELPGGQVTLANNDQIIQWFAEFDFTTRACVPVVLSVEDPDVSVCPRTSVTLGVNIEGDALDYSWVFNDQETEVSVSDSLFIESVMPENTGVYTVTVNDWCGSSEEVTLNLQYKAGTELVIPEPKWNTVYFVDNSSGNLSEFRWYLNGEEVSQKQYVDVKSMSRGDLTVTAFDEMSQCLIFGEVNRTKSASLKSAVVSPNPVVAGNPVDVILPVVSEMSRIRLYDMKGSLLIDREYGESSILQLKDTDLSSGVYLIQIEYNDGFLENKKLIIE
ncbi:choice-of-anchor Q domain-containing protein [Marinilabilia salmonicolor]|uniref:Putative secreted protein (Por secretion system target) n=1 Tax=Marinilabilia salmonicolor TaxID=989 RepID=A0A368UQL1_9BACT|nr:choice-of-anchor Q domain-containing protein [Marinilabilia salmonicolor]RCW29694.1 putative secreted protein (Por secretion system target) [Marinilabilia salmonicolor]